MKTITILLFVVTLVVIAQAEREEKKKKLMSACLIESKATEAELKVFDSDDTKAKLSEPMKCFIRCIMQGLGSMKGDVFIPEVAVNNLQKLPHFKGREADVATTISECKNLKGPNGCETAYLIARCVREHGLDTNPDN